MKIVRQLKLNLITLHFFCFLKDENDLAQCLRIMLIKFLALFTFESLSKYLHSVRSFTKHKFVYFKTTTYSRDVYAHIYFKYIKNPHLQQVADHTPHIVFKVAICPGMCNQCCITYVLLFLTRVSRQKRFLLLHYYWP